MLTFVFVISVVKIQYLSPGNPGALIDLHHTVPDGPEADAPPDRPEADKPPSTSKGTNPKRTNPQATPERTNRKRTTPQTTPKRTKLQATTKQTNLQIASKRTNPQAAKKPTNHKDYPGPFKGPPKTPRKPPKTSKLQWGIPKHAPRLPRQAPGPRLPPALAGLVGWVDPTDPTVQAGRLANPPWRPSQSVRAGLGSPGWAQLGRSGGSSVRQYLMSVPR